MPGLRASLVCCLPALLLSAQAALAAAPSAVDDAAGQCAAATRRAERRLGLPQGLLQAIALTESGRWDSADRRGLAWPWTVNSGGDGTYLDSKAEAIAYVDELRRVGRSSIDVGCMQVNLHHHPDAFADLGQAFDPIRNVDYGASFLAALQQETQSWDQAIERYHSSDPDRGRAYREKVLKTWQRLRAEASSDPSPSRPQPAPGEAPPDPPAPVRTAAPALATMVEAAPQGVWHWLAPAGRFPVVAAGAPRPLVFAGPRAGGTGSLLPGLASVPQPPARPSG